MVPDGMVGFFTSYDYMENVVSAWVNQVQSASTQGTEQMAGAEQRGGGLSRGGGG